MSTNYPELGTNIDQINSSNLSLIDKKEGRKQQFSERGITKNFAGKWIYDFKDNKLDKYYFDSYCEDINQANFIFYLKNTNQIIEHFKTKYGEPTKLKSDNKSYKDPSIQRHYGYNVLSGTWKTEDMDFRIQFRFNGGCSNYNFLFKMEFQKTGCEFS